MMDDQENSRRLRSEENFNIKSDCLFCTNYAKSNKKKRGGDVWDVKTLDFQDTIIRKCKERNDLWGIAVLGRIEHIIDLPGADAVYHQICNTNFRTGKDIPMKYQSNTSKRPKLSARSPGRPINRDQQLAFDKLVRYVETSEGKVISVSDLVKKMTELCGDKSYTAKHMKNKLIEHFGSDIVIGNLDGKSDIITLKTTASSIIHNFHKRQQNEQSDEQENIITTAAKLIKNDIQSIQCDKSFYPSSENVKSLKENLAFLPTSLLVFLNNIFVEKNSDVKIATIGQAIMQACIPRNVICPLQLGLLYVIAGNIGDSICSKRMLTGKSVQRAVRGHFMIDTALNALLMSTLYDRPLHTHVSGQLSDQDEENANESTISIPHLSETSESEQSRQTLDDTDSNVQHDDLEAISNLYDAITNGTASLDDTNTNINLKTIDEKRSNFRRRLKDNRTTQLWFQYMDMVSLLQEFLMAERIGDWEGHLSVVKSMLPYFAAAGHTHYPKSCYLYLMDMMKLPNDHPDINKAFLQGFHVVRRTARYWAGLSTDLIIEQVLMRCLKTCGGLTRGRGLTDKAEKLRDKIFVFANAPFELTLSLRKREA
ncbi:uncharacterized protein LOC132743142 [Ruditapes philippinarum]|uniref:uncharacterized protein LOC132743142 n=1 Tax=Ruditapes philippinarum TaxID=129788 RepID=UPI00295BC360|nr:uncharacterized protein LOC132743142 [Ruditapes philippinarum]